jgi:hypothetical protein
MDRERQAQQTTRALELEKEDILKNYRDTLQQIEGLQSSVDTLGQENRQIYGQLQNSKSEGGGAVV